jgi:hypothetical protein
MTSAAQQLSRQGGALIQVTSRPRPARRTRLPRRARSATSRDHGRRRARAGDDSRTALESQFSHAGTSTIFEITK